MAVLSYFIILTTRISRISFNTLFIRPILVRLSLAFKLYELVIMSKGMTANKSMKNHPLIYLIDIILRSLTTWKSSSKYVVLKTIMISKKKNTSMRRFVTVHSTLYRESSKAILTGAVRQKNISSNDIRASHAPLHLFSGWIKQVIFLGEKFLIPS